MAPYRQSPGFHYFCPRDGKPLLKEQIGPLQLATCADCRGVWMSVADFQSPGADEVGAEQERAPVGLFDASNPLRCPECREEMQRITMRAHATVDSCAEHGVWFDAGELRAIADGGGGRR